MIFIPFNVASSKNSRVWTGTHSVMSKTAKRYVENTHLVYEIKRLGFLQKLEGKEKPYRVGLYFIRDSKRKFDLINVTQIVFDLMVKHEWLSDDNADEVIPVYFGYHVDKEKCGVEITVL